MIFFEILQDDNPALNKSIHEDTLSTELGFTLTKHHHIRAYGRLSQDSTEKWHLTHQPKNPVWMEAADLGQGTSPSRRTCRTPVKKVVNLVLDPPGNLVILTPNLYLCISASRLPHETRETRRRKPRNRQQHTGLHIKRKRRPARSTRIFPGQHPVGTRSGHPNPWRPTYIQ